MADDLPNLLKSEIIINHDLIDFDDVSQQKPIISKRPIQ
jgi:hypothetical protein